jgi:DNA ligase D-like protein (predicted ligase)
MARTKQLPAFIAPMLARPGEPFDNPDWLFEVKWDGMRALAFVEGGRHRLLNRHRKAIEARYPEFAFLSNLPAGTVMDGEVVVLRQGKPDFGLLMSREHTRSALRTRTLAQSTPATYLVFDLLYDHFEPVLDRPLSERRARLRDLVGAINHPKLLLSEGVVGSGPAFFGEVCRRELEGVVAKRLSSPYQPGKRTDAWVKIKRQQEVLCEIIGFVPSGSADFGSLIIAEKGDAGLRCVGRVGTGFNEAARAELNRVLWPRVVTRPAVPLDEKGKWVAPGLTCRVRFLERTRGGELRGPSFKGLVGDADGIGR